MNSTLILINNLLEATYLLVLPILLILLVKWYHQSRKKPAFTPYRHYLFWGSVAILVPLSWRRLSADVPLILLLAVPLGLLLVMIGGALKLRDMEHGEKK